MNILRRIRVETFLLGISLVTDMLLPTHKSTTIWKLKHIRIFEIFSGKNACPLESHCEKYFHSTADLPYNFSQVPKKSTTFCSCGWQQNSGFFVLWAIKLKYKGLTEQSEFVNQLFEMFWTVAQSLIEHLGSSHLALQLRVMQVFLRDQMEI